MPRRIIINRPYGQLGNTLYRLSNIIAFAIEKDIIVWDRSMHLSGYSNLFPRIKNRLIMSYPRSLILPFSCRQFHRIQSRLLMIYIRNEGFQVNETNSVEKQLVLDESSLFGKDRNTVVLEGFHYSADAYVQKHASILRWIFIPQRKIAFQARDQASKLKNGKCLLVAVHLRRGDFKSWSSGKYYFNHEYYRLAIENTIRIHQGEDIKFVIFSDDKELDYSCFEGINYSRLHNFSNISFDWYFMSLCDYIISPLYSTYSGWASFYGETPMYRLNGTNLPKRRSDFIFKPFLNNSREHNKAMEAMS